MTSRIDALVLLKAGIVMPSGKPLVPAQELTWDVFRGMARARITSTPHAHDAFYRLVDHGVDAQELLDRLIVLAVREKRHPQASAKRTSWKETYGAPASMTWAQFLGFVRSCGKMATAIRAINDESYYDPRIWFRIHAPAQGHDLVAEVKAARTHPNSLKLKEAFLDLPTTLKLYAKFLEIASREIRKWLESLDRQSRITPTQYRDNLVEYVKQKTRYRAYMRDIAALIDATREAFRVTGPSAGTDPESLRRQANRRKLSQKKHQPQHTQ